jgi:hypothetical protein
LPEVLDRLTDLVARPNDPSRVERVEQHLAVGGAGGLVDSRQQGCRAPREGVASLLPSRAQREAMPLELAGRGVHHPVELEHRERVLQV